MENGHVNGLDAPTFVVKLKVGASEYEPRWSFLAEYLLSNRGITLKDILDEANSGGKRSTSLMMELLSACIAHHFPAGAVPDALALAGQVTGEQKMLIWPALIKAGRAAGVIVDKPPKNEQAPAMEPASNAPMA